MNRLKLNWDLSTAIERTQFLNTYLLNEEFIDKPLSPEETETCAAYVLWGKDPDGKNGDQKGFYELERKKKSWKKNPTEKLKSLDELLETPTWNENEVRPLNSIPRKVPREVFSRAEARKKAPPHILSELETLWKEIDTLELMLNFYDLAQGKRKTEPRQELLKRFSPEEITSLKLKASELRPALYLKKRHELVEKRQYQYTLKDFYSQEVLTLSSKGSQIEQENPTFGNEFFVYPLGLLQDFPQIFLDIPNLGPSSLSPELLERFSTFYWGRPKKVEGFYFDFENPAHILEFLNRFIEMEEELDSLERLEDRNLFKTFWFYAHNAGLSPIQEQILDLKIKKVPNQEIANKVNSEFNKSYTANYISTIFCQKIVPLISSAAEYHREVLENIYFKENFKTCKTCGHLYLIHPRNFVRKTRAKDGFSNRCKSCDKKDRENKKLGR